MTSSLETSPVVERSKLFDRVELIATTASTYALAACLGYEMSAEVSDISSGDVVEPRDLIVFGITAIGLAVSAAWRYAHRKTMKEIEARSE
jgi:hypothetical protein